MQLVLLRVVVVILAVYALLKLGQEFYRLIFEQGHYGAIDLLLRYREVQMWSSGMDVYRLAAAAKDPPASMPILWLFLGWMDPAAARWIFAGLSVVALVWMGHLTIRESCATSRLEAAFAVLMLLSMNATGVTVWNGQLGLVILPILITGLLLLRSDYAEWSTEMLGTGLVLTTLVKPTLTAPFAWLVLFFTCRLRPAILLGTGYFALTLFAASFTGKGLPSLIREWLANSSMIADQGYAHVHAWLSAVGLQQYDAPASLLLFVALGAWLFVNRYADAWLLIGIVALLARFWTYHRVYDNVVVVLPMIALFRIIKKSATPDVTTAAAELLLGLSVFTNLFLNSWERLPPYISAIYSGAHTLVWLAMLGFLIYMTRRLCPSHRARTQVTGSLEGKICE